MFAMVATSCPRCKGKLDEKPARLFEPGKRKPGRFEPQRDDAGRVFPS
jgi:hypothetical protein